VPPELDAEGQNSLWGMQTLSKGPTQHLFSRRLHGVTPHTATLLSVDAGPSAVPSMPLDASSEDEAPPPPLLPPPLEDEEEELDIALVAPSGVLPPVAASLFSMPLLRVPPHPAEGAIAVARPASTERTRREVNAFNTSPAQRQGPRLSSGGAARSRAGSDGR
jgi:hypothetical protein